MALVVDALGWAGAAALLLGYFLLSFRRLPSTSTRYQGLNLVGSLLLVINTGYHRAYPSALVNVIWIVIAGIALWHGTHGKD